MRLVLTREERAAVNAFVFRHLLVQGPPPLNRYYMPGMTEEKYWQSYHSWTRGGRAWYALDQGATGQLAAISWYQHVHRPGSREWRPAKIIPAVVRAAIAFHSTETSQ